MDKEKLNSNSYVYFALSSEEFDPLVVTERIGINPTNSWRKGDKGEYVPKMKYSCWQLATKKGKEQIVMYIDINEEKSTSALGHDLRIIEFLYKTNTVTDVDIYRFDSRENRYIKLKKNTMKLFLILYLSLLTFGICNAQYLYEEIPFMWEPYDLSLIHISEPTRPY